MPGVSAESRKATTQREPSVEELLGLAGEEQPTQVSYKIGDLAREFGVTLRSLRFYEDKGLLHPVRKGRTRLYSAVDRQRLRIILLSKALGFSLMEGRALVELFVSQGDERQKTRVALERFAAQRTELHDQRQTLERSIEALESSIKVLEHQLVSLPR